VSPCKYNKFRAKSDNEWTNIRKGSGFTHEAESNTKKQHKMDGIDITQTHLEQVESFIYLGSIVNGNNPIGEEIKGRISLGNKASYANQDLFKSKLLTKNSKLRMYKTLVRPAVTCACEMWVLNVGTKWKHKTQTKGI